jgi:hypothetical protein
MNHRSPPAAIAVALSLLAIAPIHAQQPGPMPAAAAAWRVECMMQIPHLRSGTSL